MFMENIKRSIASLLLTFVVILNCGCQSTENIPQISDGSVSAPPQENVTDNKNTVTAVTDNGDIITTAAESEPVTTPAETTEKILEPIPEEWIRIEDYHYALDNFDEIINADSSTGNIKDMIRSLVYKNVLYYLTEHTCTYESDRDNPIAYGEDKTMLCPASSEYFSNVKSIYELANDVYGSNDKVYIYDPSANSLYLPYSNELRLYFTEIDGQMYVNPECCIRKGGPMPFTGTSYIEITEQTEDKCKLTWHYPDVERLNEPDKYVDYYYYEGHFTAEYIDGAWKLDRIICY